jgi:hypothetical protein
MEYRGFYKNSEQYLRNIGFQTDNQTYLKLFSDDTIRFISEEVTSLLRGVSKDGRDIIVPDETIQSVLNNVYTNYRPQTGDIYSRYNIKQFEGRDDANHVITETIQIIVDQVKNEFEISQANYDLDIWDSVLLGDGISRKGLRQYAPIKLRENRPTPMLFNYTF